MAMKDLQFNYEFEDGQRITLPKFDSIMTVGFARKNRRLDQAELGWLILERAADEKTLEVIDDQSLKAFEGLMKAWQEDAGIAVGESSGSSTS